MVGDFDTNMDMEVDIYPYPNKIIGGNFKNSSPNIPIIQHKIQISGQILLFVWLSLEIIMHYNSIYS